MGPWEEREDAEDLRCICVSENLAKRGHRVRAS